MHKGARKRRMDKTQVSRRKEITKIMAEIKEIEAKNNRKDQRN